MDCFPSYPRSATYQGDEKSPGSDYHDHGASTGSGGILHTLAMFNPFGGTCPSTFMAPPYQSILQDACEAQTPDAYSATLQSTCEVAQGPDLSNRSAVPPGTLDLVDSAGFPDFKEQYPLLQPMPQPQMRYPAPEDNSQLEMGSPSLKTEESDPDFLDEILNSSQAYVHQFKSPQSASVVPQPDPGPYQDTLRMMGSCSTHYSNSQDFMMTGSMHPFGIFPLIPHDNDISVATQNQKPTPTKRGPFRDPEAKARTAATRKMGSCIRCRMQRIRCEIDPDNPDDAKAPCECCKKISLNSKVYRMPCRRWKLVDVQLSKPGSVEIESLRWTHRWKDTTAMPEITQWQGGEIKEIILSDGLHESGVRVKVRRFKVLDGDRTKRTWSVWCKDRNEFIKEEVRIEEYALVDVAAVKTAYEKYLSDVHFQMFSQDAGRHSSAQLKNFEELLGSRHGLLWKTYQHARSRRDNKDVSMKEKDLLTKVLDLWVAVRLTTRSFEISGKETLGIKRINHKILLPPVMGQQLDKLLLDHTLTKLRRETLEVLQKMVQSKQQTTWLTTYLVSFMLLHNVSLITKHDMEYAQKHAADNKMLIWTRPMMVQQYHLGANILLAYFHYCNRGTFPFSDECKDSDLKNLAKLETDAIKFVGWTREQAELHKDQWQQERNTGFERSSADDAHWRYAKAYSDPYFFVSQLYETNWTPRDTHVDKTSCRMFGPRRPTVGSRPSK